MNRCSHVNIHICVGTCICPSTIFSSVFLEKKYLDFATTHELQIKGDHEHH